MYAKREPKKHLSAQFRNPIAIADCATILMYGHHDTNSYGIS